MSKSKKARKETASEDEDESSSNSSDSSSEDEASAVKQKKSKKENAKKSANKKKKSKRASSESEDSSSTSSSSASSDSSSSESSSSESENDSHKKKRKQTKESKTRNGSVEGIATKQKFREHTHASDAVEPKRHEETRGGSGHRDSKWESPPRAVEESRRRRTRSRERERERRRESRDRDHERDRGRDREQDRYRGGGDERRVNDYHDSRHRGGGGGGYGGRGQQRYGDRRDNRDRDTDRYGDGGGGRYRDDVGNRNRYNERRCSRSPRQDRDRPRRFDDNGGARGRRDSPQSRQHPPHRQRQRGNSDDNESYEWGKKTDNERKREPSVDPADKEKPNFGLSGALTEDTNKVNGVVVKYAEPPEARKPKRRWRLYPFKGETALPTLHIHRQSCFLVGRDRKVVDLAVDHPSCSKQHAALQYRLVPFEREDGTTGKRVRPYLIDLESANGTFLNNKKVDARKYYELMEKDVIKFGFSTREYVLLHENSKEDQEDDDVDVKEEPADAPTEEPQP